MTYFVRCTLLVLALGAMIVPTASAQTPDRGEDPDLEVNVAQPDFILATLPTNLRLPKGKFAFRITHRFARPLSQGDFGGLRRRPLRIRLGRADRTRAALRPVPRRAGRHQPHLDCTIQLFSQYDVVSQQSFPIGIGAWGSIDGTNNFRDSYSPALGVILSRELGEHGAVYAEPIWVNNTNAEPSELVDDNSTLMLGLGTRLRLRPTVYVTAEVSPRLAGYAPGDRSSASASRSASAATPSPSTSRTASGRRWRRWRAAGRRYDDWYIGFNIARKFY